MKYYFLLILVLIISSCNLSETIKIKDNGSGSIVTEENTDEELYKKFAGESYGKNEKSQDTIYFFNDFINKYNKTFFNFPTKDRIVLLTYKDVQVEINKNLRNKIFKTKISQNFIKIEDVPDLYKVEDLAEDLKKNFNLGAEGHYFKLKYSYDGTVFRRIVEITNKQNQENKILEIEDIKAQFAKLPVSQKYVLNYTFPKKIKYISNNNAVLSSDKKTMKLEFILSDCIENPDITNLEIVLENN